jgi:hypothetical protein
LKPASAAAVVPQGGLNHRAKGQRRRQVKRCGSASVAASQTFSSLQRAAVVPAVPSEALWQNVGVLNCCHAPVAASWALATRHERLLCQVVQLQRVASRLVSSQGQRSDVKEAVSFLQISKQSSVSVALDANTVVAVDV